ncbi:hypothetical protein ACLB2K_023061 [Fragaria x ananassa]
MIEYLPGEMIQTIMFRLPVNHNVNNRDGAHLLLLHSGCCRTSPPIKEEVYSLHYDNRVFEEYCKIDFHILRVALGMGEQNFRVVDICHWLVCLADNSIAKTSKYMLWNLSIRKALMLPSSGLTYITHGHFEESIGFGFDVVTSDYKVVRLVTVDGRETLAEVYSLVRDSWRSLGSVKPSCQIYGTQPSAFCNGAIHWAVKRWTNGAFYYFILTFDVGSELFREITMPESTKYPLLWESRVSVSGDGNSLALLSTYRRYTGNDYLVDLWVMKDYCVQESWTKMITLGPQRDIPKTLTFGKSGTCSILASRRLLSEE